MEPDLSVKTLEGEEEKDRRRQKGWEREDYVLQAL